MSDTPARDERQAPIPNSYWLPDGNIIAGEYPGSVHAADAREKVRMLLDAGVRLFVDLTHAHELHPYEEIALDEARSRGADQFPPVPADPHGTGACGDPDPLP